MTGKLIDFIIKLFRLIVILTGFSLAAGSGWDVLSIVICTGILVLSLFHLTDKYMIQIGYGGGGVVVRGVVRVVEKNISTVSKNGLIEKLKKTKVMIFNFAEK